MLANTCIVRRASTLAVMAALLVVGACKGGGEDPPVGPTVPLGGTSTTATSTTVAPTSTTLGPEAYEVPAVIDQAYVQRVVSAYDKVLGDAIRVLKRDGGLSEEFLKHLLAIYTAEEFEFQQKLWAESVAQGRVERTPEDAKDPVTTVTELRRADRTCVVARAERDFSPNLTGEQAESPQDDFVVLVARDMDRDPLSLNPTPWVLAFDGYNVDNSEPNEKCGV